MAVGLEVRVPFCDHRLVQYVWNIPWNIKTVGDREKGILREAVKDLLPHEVLYRKKSGYPGTQNPSYDEAVRSGVLDILSDANAPLLALVDKDKVKRLLAPAETGDSIMTEAQMRTHYLAFLVQVNKWLEDYHISIRA